MLEKAAGYFEKTQKITDAIGKLIGNKAFQDNLRKAGSLGALISIGIGIYQQVKHDLQTEDERAFGSLMKIAFETYRLLCVQQNDYMHLYDKTLRIDLYWKMAEAST